MKKTYFVVILFLTGAFLVPAFAAEQVRVTTVFDKRTVNVAEEIKLTIRIAGGQANVLRPRIPSVDFLESYYTGRANQFTFINGRSANTTSFSYVLVPKRAGKFMLPPIEVEVDNQIFRTDPIEIEVLGASSGSSPVSSGAPAGPAASQTALRPPPFAGSSAPGPAGPFTGQVSAGSVQKPMTPTVTPETEKNIFLNIFADKHEAYPNEQILLTYSVYTRVSARAEQFEKDPNMGGFWVEEIPIEKEYQPAKVIFDGLQYLKADVKRLAVFPTTTGTFEIDPGVFRATIKKEAQQSGLFDDFFDESFFGGSFFAQREAKLLTAKPLKLVVRPFPDQGRPADFSNMAGQFEMMSSVDKKVVKQNEPVILSLVIEGEGNIEMIERPKIPELRDVKIYDSDSSTELAKYRGGVRGKKSFEVTLIPTAAGDFEIPPLTFSYFDPRKGSYQTLRTPAYQIYVTPGPAVPLPETLKNLGAAGDLKKKIERESRDIHFIKEGFSLREKGFRGGGLEKFFLAVNGALSLSGFFLFIRRRHEDKLDKNVALKRSRYAPQSARKGIALLKKLRASHKPEGIKRFFEEAPRVMNSYFADKFNVSAQGLMFYDIEKRLLEKEMDAARVEALRAFYETCDLVRFTSSGIADARRDELIKVIQDMIDFLEKK